MKSACHKIKLNVPGSTSIGSLISLIRTLIDEELKTGEPVSIEIGTTNTNNHGGNHGQENLVRIY